MNPEGGEGGVMKGVIRVAAGLSAAVFSMFILGVQAQAASRYVSPAGNDAGNDCLSPGSPCATIQHAVDAAGNFDVIRVARGTYAGLVRVASPLNALAIQGGWDGVFAGRTADPSQTVLDGGGSSGVVLLQSNITNLNVSIEGLEIRNGSAGVGIASVGAAMGVGLKDCIVTRNQPGGRDTEPSLEILRADTIEVLSPAVESTTGSGGIFAYSMASSSLELTVTDCEITRNAGFSGGIAVIGGHCAVTLTGNTIESNLSAFGDLDGSSDAPPLAGGVSLIAMDQGEITATLARNSILGNGGLGAGGVSISSAGSTVRAVLENNLIANNNTPGSGGGIAVRARMDSPHPGEISVAVTNDTITGNTCSGAESLGGGLYVGSDDPRNAAEVQVANTILWGNSAADGGDAALDGLLATLGASYSDIGDVRVVSGNYSKDALVDRDPLFRDPSTGDFHLDRASPLLSAAECGFWVPSAEGWKYTRTAPAEDFEGDLRPGGTGQCCEPQLWCDIGADEHNLLPLPEDLAGMPAHEAPVLPVRSADPSLCRPFAAGPLERGVLDLRIGLPEIAGEADVYLGLSIPGLSDLVLITPSGALAWLADGLVPWRSSTTGDFFHPILGEIPSAGLPPGRYGLHTLVTPAGSPTAGYLWTGFFEVE